MKTSIALGFAALLVSAVSTQADPVDVFTNFTIPADTTNTATFSINALGGQLSGLDEIGELSSPGSDTFNVAYRFFTPSVSGTYSVGIASATYDPVLIVYSGQTSFPATSPGTGAIGFNDDSLTISFNGINFLLNGRQSGVNPLVTGLSLTAGINYLVAATSYTSDTPIPLPLTFFVYGPAQVTVGDAGAAIPEPSSYAVIAGALALGVVGAGRRRRAV